MPLTAAGRRRLSRLARAQQRDGCGRFSRYCRDERGRFAPRRAGWLGKWSRVHEWEHIEESEAMLRSEGIADPAAWDEVAREAARSYHRLAQQANTAQSLHATARSLRLYATSHTSAHLPANTWVMYDSPTYTTSSTTTSQYRYPQVNYTSNTNFQPYQGWDDWRVSYAPAPQPRHHLSTERVSRRAFVDFGGTYENFVAQHVADLQRRVEHDEREEYGEVMSNATWYTWIRHPQPGDDLYTADQVEIGVGHTESPPEQMEGQWRQWTEAGIQVAVAQGRPRVPTPEEQRAAEEARQQAEEAREQQRVRAEAHARERAEANERAEVLLREHLTEDQLADWERANRFELMVGDKRYRIARGYQGNVYALDDDGEAVERFCIHAPSTVPEADQVLSQKLLLETDEERFRSVANITRLRTPQQPPRLGFRDQIAQVVGR